MKKFRSYFEAASAGFFLPSPNFEIWKIIILKFQSSKFKVQNSRNYTGWLHYPTWGGAEVPVTCWNFWCYMYWRRSIAKIFHINNYSLPFFPGICQSGHYHKFYTCMNSPVCINFDPKSTGELFWNLRFWNTYVV